MQNALTVSQLNQYIADLFSADENLHGIRVQGEITGFKRHTSGHLYFSLKDANALVRCVMFRQQALRLSFQPEDGMQVVLTGYASLYVRDGAFQLYAMNLQKQGEGELFARFLALKEQLEKDGWFDEAGKKTLPYLPERVGVVTSETGAALQDILQVIGRRFPRMPVVIGHASVQGEGAAEEIAWAIGEMNRQRAADVLIVGRGGGAYEDLWAFNEMPVIQAIRDSKIPVISAVGHEVDFTIADFVADRRAPTPSAAAELAVPEYSSVIGAVAEYGNRLNRGLSAALARTRDRVRILSASRGFLTLETRLSSNRQTLDLAGENMKKAMTDRLKETRLLLNTVEHRLSALNPSNVLARGYGVISDETGRILTSAEDLYEDEKVRLTLHRGAANAIITKVDRENGGKN